MCYDCYEMSRPRCYETAAEKQRAYRLRKKGLPFLKEEAEPESTVLRTEMAQPDQTSKGETLGYLRRLIGQEEGKPATSEAEIVETRSAKDVVGGIYRNDNGGVISKFAWEKLQRMKEHAKANNFEIDDYSQ